MAGLQTRADVFVGAVSSPQVVSAFKGPRGYDWIDRSPAVVIHRLGRRKYAHYEVVHLRRSICGIQALIAPSHSRLNKLASIILRWPFILCAPERCCSTSFTLQATARRFPYRNGSCGSRYRWWITSRPATLPSTKSWVSPCCFSF